MPPDSDPGSSTRPDSPVARVASADGALIAVFALQGTGGPGRPVILVHGASADHTTWRVSGPLLARSRPVLAIDRRGRGASSDGGSYDVGLEYADVAAVAQWVAEQEGSSVDVVGHSFGGRVALGAALRTPAIRRVVAYESAPPAPGQPYQEPGLVERLHALADSSDGDALLSTFLTEVVGMSAADLAAYRADPIWPRRVAAAHTIVRELEAETSPAASLDSLGNVEQPVLQVLGGDSREVFAIAVRALDERLSNGRVEVIPGARHAAHHTHAAAFVAAVQTFLH
jgi:pimeloyl-ACP methyl ester carboxylesterase